MSNQEKPQNPTPDQKFNPKSDVKPSRDPLPVEKNPTQSTDRGNRSRDDQAK